jgi:uncharacterized protein YkwD
VCVAAGTTPLRLDYRLQCAARVHARDMHLLDYATLEGPDGLTPEDRSRQAGYTVSSSAAAIEHGATADEVFADLNSSEDPACVAVGGLYRDIGIGKAGDSWSLVAGSE